jgi:hypothetical protein
MGRYLREKYGDNAKEFKKPNQLVINGGPLDS